MVVVLVCPQFPSLRYILCLISLMMSSYPFEMIGSWSPVAMVVVLVCPQFPSLRYILHLSPLWCPHIPVFTICCIYHYHYCSTDSRSICFPVENGGSSWNFWELAVGERGQLEVEDEKENMPLVDTIAFVARFACCAWDFGTRLRLKSSVVTKHI